MIEMSEWTETLTEQQVVEFRKVVEDALGQLCYQMSLFRRDAA